MCKETVKDVILCILLDDRSNAFCFLKQKEKKSQKEKKFRLWKAIFFISVYLQ